MRRSWRKKEKTNPPPGVQPGAGEVVGSLKKRKQHKKVRKGGKDSQRNRGNQEDGDYYSKVDLTVRGGGKVPSGRKKEKRPPSKGTAPQRLARSEVSMNSNQSRTNPYEGEKEGGLKKGKTGRLTTIAKGLV